MESSCSMHFSLVTESKNILISSYYIGFFYGKEHMD